jgi:NADH:ubiquinone oxidoreductase subunit 5 (subunit L)/multisubunit Na+/H+ antiporter MnhA subunit
MTVNFRLTNELILFIKFLILRLVTKLNVLLRLLFLIRLGLNSLIFKHTQLLIHLALGQINSTSLDIRIRLDMFRALFLTTVLLISFAVFRFRYSYISANRFFSRFNILLFVFVFSILLLIISSNLIFTIVGWDGLGIRSYLLVIYYGRRKSYNAGILTVLRNRLGDVAILFSIGLILQLGS